ncbi:MAG: dienelactone hydrolase family protein, partial [Actinomycetota bacterium]|nr:dienelactone hydrolase family protein [Actinomycetota bacterium]
ETGRGQPASTSTTQTTATAAPTTPVPTQDITYPGRDGTLMGAYAPATAPRGAVLVIHENRGLVEGTKAVAGRLAGDGFTALAVDLLSKEGGTARVPADQVRVILNDAGRPRLLADVRSSIDELARRHPSLKLCVTGFCFGGTVTWDLLADGEARLAAAAPWYGTVPADVDFSKSRAAVFAVYGETDARVNATREAARSALEKAGLTHEIKTYPGVGHAFYNQVDSPQSREAYQDVVNWFGRHLR